MKVRVILLDKNFKETWVSNLIEQSVREALDQQVNYFGSHKELDVSETEALVKLRYGSQEVSYIRIVSE